MGFGGVQPLHKNAPPVDSLIGLERPWNMYEAKVLELSIPVVDLLQLPLAVLCRF